MISGIAVRNQANGGTQGVGALLQAGDADRECLEAKERGAAAGRSIGYVGSTRRR